MMHIYQGADVSMSLIEAAEIEEVRPILEREQPNVLVTCLATDRILVH